MAWVVPRAWVVSELITSAKLNEISSSLSDLDRRTSPLSDYVATSESTTSSSFGNLTTTGPTIVATIGSTGKALTGVYARIDNTVSPNGTGLMGFAFSGASTVAAADNFSIQGTLFSTSGAGMRFGSTFLVTGLNAGITTTQAQYRNGTGGNSATFQDRRLLQTPLGS